MSDVMDPDSVRFCITMVPSHPIHVSQHYESTEEVRVDKLSVPLTIEVSKNGSLKSVAIVAETATALSGIQSHFGSLCEDTVS